MRYGDEAVIPLGFGVAVDGEVDGAVAPGSERADFAAYFDIGRHGPDDGRHVKELLDSPAAARAFG